MPIEHWVMVLMAFSISSGGIYSGGLIVSGIPITGVLIGVSIFSVDQRNFPLIVTRLSFNRVFRASLDAALILLPTRFKPHAFASL